MFLMNCYCCKGYTEKSAIAEHAQDQQHTINWEDIKVLDKTCSASSKGSLMHSGDPC